MPRTKPKSKPKAKPAPPPVAPPPLRLEYRSPAELAENPLNWRRHPEAQIAALSDVITEVGWAGACLLNERTGRLIDGHARRKVALAQGCERVPVLVGDWSEADEAKILATLDPLAAMAEADATALDALLRDVQTDSEAVGAMLAGLKAANPLAEVLPTPGGGGDDFDAAPADGPTRAAVGDLWVIGGKHRLLVGDCTDPANVARLMGGAVAALVWSDPPYGYSYQSNMRERGERFEVLANDDKILAGFVPVAAACSEGWFLVCTSWKVFAEWLAATAPLGDLQNVIVWDKGGGGMGDLRHSLSTDYELVLAYNRGAPIQGKRIGSVWSIGKDRPGDYQHATQKPIALVEQAINTFSPARATVYDPFLGSGTTLIAAHRLGRVCYGCELDPRYADVILKRAEAEGLAVEKAG